MHPYVIGAALGQGGFGITYIALDMVTNERVAIKEYFPTFCANRSSGTVSAYPNQEDTFLRGKERFLDEARTLKCLSDLNSIVNVLDFFEFNNSAYLVMEFLDGCSLKEYAAQNGKFPAQKFLRQIRPLMEDLERMHQRGVVHRDIAPDNIILLPDGQMKLIDFGAARSFMGDKSMTVVVKKGFAPIEQYLTKGTTASTDVYALAATIYYCITGIVPTDSAERQYDNVPLQRPSSLGADITPAQELALEKALEVQQKARIQSVQAFLDALHVAEDVKTDNASVPKLSPRKILPMVLAAAAVILGISFATIPGISPEMQVPEASAVQEEITDVPVYTSADSPAYSEDAWKNNVLRSNPELAENQKAAGQIFGTSIPAPKVKTVTFLDTVANAPETNWDVSEAGDGSVLAWVEENDSFYDLYIGANGGINGAAATKGLFAGFINLEEVRFNGVYHTEQAESFASMFYRCINLVSADISGLDTSCAKSMAYMFFKCLNLSDLNLGKLNTKNVTNMSMLFFECEGLQSLDFSDFDTSKVQDMNSMFARCYNLTQLNVQGMNTENVINMQSMFRECGNLSSLDLSGFDTANVQNMTQMFEACTALTHLNLSSFDTSNVTEMVYMFDDCHNLTNVNIGNFDTSKVDSYYKFMEDGKQINGQPWEDFFP